MISQKALSLYLLVVVLAISGCKDESKPYYDFYVGTYTKKEGHVDGKGTGIYQMRLNMKDTTLQRIGLISNIINPSFIKLSKDKKTLYAVSELAPGDSLGKASISAYRVEANQATRMIETLSRGSSPCHIALNPDNSLCVISNYFGETAVVFPLLQDGNINEVSQSLNMGGKSIDTIRQEAGHLHSAIFTNDGKHCYFADLGADRIHMYSIDPQSKSLRPLKKRSFYPLTTKGAGPRHMVVSPDNKYLFVLNELNNTITTYKISKDGDLETLTTISSLSPGYSGASLAADIHITKNGKTLYVSNRGADNIGAYKVDGSGKLTLIGHYNANGKTPRNFAITSDENFIIVANQDTNTIVLMKINNDGSLTGIKSFEVTTPVCIEEI